MTRGLHTALLVVVILLTTARAVRPESSPGPPAGATHVRVAYTASVFSDIAESDARAAIKVWTEAAAREMSMPLAAEVQVVPDPERLVRLLDSGEADFAGMTTLEFLPLEPRLAPDPIFVVSRGGSARVEYLLLVRNDSGITRLADLGHAELMCLDSPLTSLALPWLDVRLAAEGRPPAADYFARVARATKLSAVILPVFFGRAKACLVTREGFKTMVELNPQLGRDLRILVESPGYVPMLSFLRRAYMPPFRQDLVDAILRMHRTAAGRQILTMVQGNAMELLPPEELDSARELLRAWRRRETRQITTHDAGRSRPRMTRGAGE